MRFFVALFLRRKIQTADYRWQTAEIGSSRTADPYNETLRYAQGDKVDVILSVAEESQLRITHYKLRIKQGVPV